MPETLVGGRRGEHCRQRKWLGEQGREVIMVASENGKQVTDLEPRASGGGGRKGLGARTGMINKSPLWRILLSK